MNTAKQNQKFPFHFLSAPPTPPAEEKKKGKENFWFLLPRPQGADEARRLVLARIVLEKSSDFVQETQPKFKIRFFAKIQRFYFLAAGPGFEPRYHAPVYPAVGGEACVLFHPAKFPSRAAGLGLEPRFADPESAGLPLADPAALEMNFSNAFPFFQLFILFSRFLTSLKLENC